ncbi:MAG: hypothetical protein K0041_08485 [Acidithiobacillus sp.]|nr:hypothetical protein [Acidithiobacillus sp.]
MSLPYTILDAQSRILSAPIPEVCYTDRLILGALITFVNIKNPTQPIFPSVRCLHDRLSMPEITIKKGLARLRKIGLIERLEQEHSERTGNFRTVRTLLSEHVLALANLLGAGVKEEGRTEEQQQKKRKTSTPQEQTSVAQKVTVQEHIQAQEEVPAPQPQENEPAGEETAAQGDTRPGISEIRAIENCSTPNKKTNCTVSGGHKARKETLPEDIAVWVDRGIAPWVLASCMKMARQAGTTLSAILLDIGERLRNATNPNGYLVGTLQRIREGKEPVWKDQRPETCLSPKEADQRQRQYDATIQSVIGQWFTDGTLYYHPTGNLTEVYSRRPASSAEHPDRAPIPTTTFVRYWHEKRVHSATIPDPIQLLSLRDALRGMPCN